MANRSNKTFSTDEEVDQWLDDFTQGEDYNRSDVMNRAVKVYAAKMASGEWNDPKFRDKIDEKFKQLR